MDDGNSPHGVTIDTLITAAYKLNAAYRANASWVANSNTWSVIRKLKDSQNAYLWQPATAMGQPDRLLGFPCVTWEQMDDLDVSGGGNTTFPIAVGDWRRAYTIADRHEVRILLDQVTEVGFTKFYVRKRTYGAPMNVNAAKFVRSTA